MKKVILFSIAVMSCMFSKAQTEKGKMFIGGQVSYAGSSRSQLDTLSKSDIKTSSLGITPGFGYFIKDHLAVGASLNLGVSNTSNNFGDPTKPLYGGGTKTTQTIYGIGIFVRHYSKILDQFFFTVNGSASYLYEPGTITTTKNDPSYIFSASNPAKQNTTTGIFTVALAPGLVYFVTPKFGIQASFGNVNYSNTTSKNTTLLHTNHNNSESYGINLNLNSFGIGMSYYF